MRKNILFDFRSIVTLFHFGTVDKNIKETFSAFATDEFTINQTKYYLRFIADDGEDEYNLLSSNITHLHLYVISSTDKEKFLKIIDDTPSDDTTIVSHIALVSQDDEDKEDPRITPIKASEDIPAKLKSILSNMITKYVNMVNSKPTLLNKNNTIDQKNYLLVKQRCEEYLTIGVYDIPQQCFKILSESIKIPSEQTKFREFSLIAKFFQNLSIENSDENSFDSSIEKAYNEHVFPGYKKSKQVELLVESYLRLLSYYSMFPDKEKALWSTVQKIFLEIQKMNNFFKYKIFISVYYILKDLSLKRKSLLFLYLAVVACYEETDLYPRIPFLYREMNKIFPFEEEALSSQELFDSLHNSIRQRNFKPICFYMKGRDEEKEKVALSNKKRIEKDFDLYVVDPLKFKEKLFLRIPYEPIQYNIYSNLITYYRASHLNYEKIKYIILLLSCENVSLKEQKRMYLEMKNDAIFSQKKHEYTMLKLPILIKIAPMIGDIKFDIARIRRPKPQKTTEEVKTSDVFIYNPWEKKNFVNYYFTEDSEQKFLVKFYNPLSIEIQLTKISLITNSDKVHCIPCHATLMPRCNNFVIVTIRISSLEPFSVTGVRYELENIFTKQYVDKNGNGVFYTFNHICKDVLNGNKKKEVVNLENIQIFPRIPQCTLLCVNHSDNDITLFEYEQYEFEFEIKSTTKEDQLEEITVNIFGYKKDDYKISINESTHSVNANEFNYKFLYTHKKDFKKIEFKFYYKTHNMTEKIKPFLYMVKNIKSKKLLNFTMINISPMIIDSSFDSLYKISNDFSKCFCSNKYLVSFGLSLVQDLRVSYMIKNPEDVIDQGKEIGFLTEKKISLYIDSNKKLSRTVIDWKSENNFGSVNLFQILVNELQYKFNQPFCFEISSETTQKNSIDCLNVCYTVHNLTGRDFNGMILKILLYQTHDNIFEVNTQLNSSIFYDGSLIITVNIKPNEVFKYEITLYPIRNEIIHTTFSLINNSHKIIYLPTFSHQCVFK